MRTEVKEDKTECTWPFAIFNVCKKVAEGRAVEFLLEKNKRHGVQAVHLRMPWGCDAALRSGQVGCFFAPSWKLRELLDCECLFGKVMKQSHMLLFFAPWTMCVFLEVEWQLSRLRVEEISHLFLHFTVREHVLDWIHRQLHWCRARCSVFSVRKCNLLLSCSSHSMLSCIEAKMLFATYRRRWFLLRTVHLWMLWCFMTHAHVQSELQR